MSMECASNPARRDRGAAMWAETDYLHSSLAIAMELPLTLTTPQRPRCIPSSGRHLEPGLAFSGGRVWAADAVSGVDAGLVFSARVWFSDRVVNRGANPTVWQQFSVIDPGPVTSTFSLNGAHVLLHAQLTRTGSVTESFAFDSSNEQLLFRVHGAGAGVPDAIVLSSFGPRGCPVTGRGQPPWQPESASVSAEPRTREVGRAFSITLTPWIRAHILLWFSLDLMRETVRLHTGSDHGRR